MPVPERRPPPPTPPSGVPRWLWPPPGATVRCVRIRETVDERGRATFSLTEGEPLEPLHLRALTWLLDEHPREGTPPLGVPFAGEVVLSVARTPMAGGRVGHAYAIDGGPLGAPRASVARGILWRYLAHALA